MVVLLVVGVVDGFGAGVVVAPVGFWVVLVLGVGVGVAWVGASPVRRGLASCVAADV